MTKQESLHNEPGWSDEDRQKAHVLGLLALHPEGQESIMKANEDRRRRQGLQPLREDEGQVDLPEVS